MDIIQTRLTCFSAPTLTAAPIPVFKGLKASVGEQVGEEIGPIYWAKETEKENLCVELRRNVSENLVVSKDKKLSEKRFDDSIFLDKKNCFDVENLSVKGNEGLLKMAVDDTNCWDDEQRPDLGNLFVGKKANESENRSLFDAGVSIN
jgi:hypothetical protein